MNRFLLLFVLSASSACAVNPITGGSQLMLVSESREIEMGREVDRRIIASPALYGDSAWQRYIRDVGARLAATSERGDLPWMFRVLDDPGVNAFALPGGFVYVTRGILAYLGSEGQLAAVLGHEIGHVTARHAVAQLSKRRVAGIGLVVASVVGAVVSPNTGDYATSALGQGMDLLFLSNSRAAEREADVSGIAYMERAGYNPNEMREALGMLVRVSRAEGSGEVPEWRSTHPDPEHRLERVAATIAAFPGDSGDTLVGREGYLTRLDGLVFGENRPGRSLSGGRLVVAEEHFEITFPSDWRVRTWTYKAEATTEDHAASVELTTVDQPNADSAARAFFSGLTVPDGPATADSVNGLAAVSRPFSAWRERESVRGRVTFIEYRGKVYRVTGFATRKEWQTYREAAESSARTFRPLPDSAWQRMQPLRIHVLSLNRPTSLAALARETSAPLDPGSLSLLNGVEPDSVIPAGRLVKWLVGAPQR